MACRVSEFQVASSVPIPATGIEAADCAELVEPAMELTGMVPPSSDSVCILSPFLNRDRGSEKIRHLVQDEPLIASIHNEELPPDIYYERLSEGLADKFPAADPCAIEHVVALCAAFDTASSFGLSFGVKKFQFMQK